MNTVTIEMVATARETSLERRIIYPLWTKKRIHYIWRVLCQKQVSRERTNNYIPRIQRHIVIPPLDTCFGHNTHHSIAWWRHQMTTFPALLVIFAGNSPVTPVPVMRTWVNESHWFNNRWWYNYSKTKRQNTMWVLHGIYCNVKLYYIHIYIHIYIHSKRYSPSGLW